MSLGYWDLSEIHKCLERYEIKYQEIYNEVYDHIATAVEERRNSGDAQDVIILFNEVVDQHFGGYNGIEKLAKTEEKIYGKSIRKEYFWGIKLYLNWKTLVLTAILIALSTRLPNDWGIHAFLAVFIIAAAFGPLFYTYFIANKYVKLTSGRKSLLKSHLITNTMLPGILANCIIYYPKIFLDTDTHEYTLFKSLPIPALLLIAVFMVVLGFSSIRLCKIALAKNTLLKTD